MNDSSPHHNPKYPKLLCSCVLLQSSLSSLLLDLALQELIILPMNFLAVQCHALPQACTSLAQETAPFNTMFLTEFEHNFACIPWGCMDSDTACMHMPASVTHAMTSVQDPSCWQIALLIWNQPCCPRHLHRTKATTAADIPV